MEGTPGVQRASVALTLSMAEVTYDPRLTDTVSSLPLSPVLRPCAPEPCRTAKLLGGTQASVPDLWGLQGARKPIQTWGEAKDVVSWCAQDALVGVIEGAGFEARSDGKGAAADVDSAVLRISGMTCSSCSSAVEAALAAHKGVRVSAPAESVRLLQAASCALTPFSETIVAGRSCPCTQCQAVLKYTNTIMRRARAERGGEPAGGCGGGNI